MNIKEIFDINNGQTLCKDCHRSIGHKNIKDKSVFNKKNDEEGTRHWSESKHCWDK